MRLPLPPAATLALTLAVTPVLVVVPTLGRPGGEAHPVGPQVVAVPLRGVDGDALRELRASGHAEPPELPPDLRRALAGDLAANPVPGPPPQVLTPELTADDTGAERFDLVAVSWQPTDRTQARPAVEVRVREEAGWTGWQPLDGDADGPDGTSPEIGPELGRGPSATAPLLTNGADAVQVRVDTPDGSVPPGLRVDLVDGGSSGADAPAPPPASAAADTSQPVVVTRRQWGADEKLVTGTPSTAPAVRALFVHHTDTTNAYTAAQAYAQVRAIYAFHTKVRGWNDIGYNLLVDRFGHVFEGRRGSLTRAVTGAHTGGFNSQSLGIATLGTFSSATPPPAALRALADVIGWKAAQYELDPRATVRLVSAGGPFTAYKPGQGVRAGAVSSHRDVGQTECPGDGLWGQLPWLRRQVAAKMRPGLAGAGVSAASAVAGGNGVLVTGAVPTTQRWTVTATPRCRATPVRTLTGRATSRIAARWNLRDDKGAPVAPGIYRLTLTTRSPVGSAPAWSSDVEVLPAESSRAGTCPVRRVVAAEGASAVARAVAVGRTIAPDAATVVLAGVGAAGVDGVVAAPLARALGAPLLFTDTAQLSPEVAAEVQRRKATRVVVVGSALRVAEPVLAQLSALGVTTVERVSGTSAAGTAAAVARALAAAPRPAGTPAPTGALLARLHRNSLADAAVLGSVAAATGRPVLIVDGRDVPPVTQQVIRDLKLTSATVAGSTADVPDRALRALPGLGVRSWTRVVGTGRAGLAVALARTLPRDTGDTWLGVPADAGVPDVAAAGAAGRPVLLVPGVVTPGLRTWFAERRPARTWVLGGTAQVPVPLFAALTEVAR